MVNVYIVEGIRPQLILGLPWIKQEQPQVEWGDAATLVFPDGSKWTSEEETYDLTQPPTIRDNPGLCSYLEVVQKELGGKSVDDLCQLKDTQAAVVVDWLKSITHVYSELFTPLTGVLPDDRIQHAIHLVPGALPVMKRPYRLSAEQKKSADKQIRNAIQERWIQPSTSPWGTAILMVPKKDNT